MLVHSQPLVKYKFPGAHARFDAAPWALLAVRPLNATQE